MKRIKALLTTLLIITVMLSFTGCGRIIALIDSKAIAEAEAVPRVSFSRELISEGGEEHIMTAEELCETELSADDYRSDFHYSRLSEGEKTAYTALEYALEYGYRYIYVDDLLVSSGETLEKLFEYLSMDSPLVEQNYTYSTGTFTTYYKVRMSQAELAGYYIYVKNFTRENWVKKEEAILKAKSIVSAMPADLSDIEAARYLYKYTVENVEYFDYENGYDTDKDMSLYDGLINGKTHCDGSANMYGLLLNLAGFECVEKVHSNPEAEGHTWNFFKIGDKWYNADATAPEDRESLAEEAYWLRYFGFADTMQSYSTDYAELYPEAAECIDYRLTQLSEISKSSFVKTAKEEFSENGRKLAVFIVDGFNEKNVKSAMQRLANSLGGQVTWIHYDVLGERKVLFVTA